MVSHKKVGGLHFIRVGRLSMSFCMRQPNEGYETQAGNAAIGAVIALSIALMIITFPGL